MVAKKKGRWARCLCPDPAGQPHSKLTTHEQNPRHHRCGPPFPLSLLCGCSCFKVPFCLPPFLTFAISRLYQSKGFGWNTSGFGKQSSVGDCWFPPIPHFSSSVIELQGETQNSDISQPSCSSCDHVTKFWPMGNEQPLQRERAAPSSLPVFLLVAMWNVG